MTPKILTATAVFSLFLCALFAGSAAGDAAALNVFVSIPPQSDFVKAIAGEHVDVSVMVQPGKSPASYEPTPKQMVNLAKSDIYFAIGVPFETAWLSKFADTNPAMRIVHTEAGLEKKPIHRHQGHHKTDHPPGGIKDPHIWLSPPLVMQQARNILSGLKAVDPPNADDFEQNYKVFIDRLVELDIALMQKFENISNPRFMVFHPSWGYFADAYGLDQIAIEIEGKAPKAKDVAALIQTARQNNITVIFAQPQFSNKQAQIIAKEIGGTLVQADPLATDWETNLRRVASAIKQELN